MTRPSCPRCGLTGTLTLLTSMNIYFLCDRCGNRWEIPASATRADALEEQRVAAPDGRSAPQ